MIITACYAWHQLWLYHREEYLMQQKLSQTARLTGLPLPPTARTTSGGRPLTSCGSLNASRTRRMVSSPGTQPSCGDSVASRPQTVPRSLSRLGMRRSADSLSTAAAAAAAATSTSGKCLMLHCDIIPRVCALFVGFRS